ncbi:MAG: NUDIX domain-containing protein [Sandaracinus sp.]|nr:NUDIX domain-containing protein [Myxococcales bacterium]MCB9604531.1 NUDIX domain-containing protein [Sandaracinus sp.]MCB9614477.1 NUDIX domain-containing protein [Sandaracinus sp.]
MTRSSHIVYAVARFRANDRVVWLLRRHPKWGDWSLVGGHVEEDEREDWDLAIRREVDEEMEPLHVGAELVIVPVAAEPSVFRRVSQSAGGVETEYTVRWYGLSFRGDVSAALSALPADDFVFVDEEDLPRGVDGVADVTRFAPLDRLPAPTPIDALTYERFPRRVASTSTQPTT